MDYIKIEDLVDRCIYKIFSRNLSYGVWNEKNKGFIGIREKFNSKYLFTEYHYDVGPPFGTVKPQNIINIKIDDEILLSESLPTLCFNCKEGVYFVKDQGWRHDIENKCLKIEPYGPINIDLFNILKNVEENQNFK